MNQLEKDKKTINDACDKMAIEAFGKTHHSTNTIMASFAMFPRIIEALHASKIREYTITVHSPGTTINITFEVPKKKPKAKNKKV
jgi:hypothetical protein